MHICTQAKIACRVAVATHGLAFVTDEAADVKNVDPALSASITFQVKGFVLVFCLSAERAFSSFRCFGVMQDISCTRRVTKQFKSSISNDSSP